jgi:hypothetical protein
MRSTGIRLADFDINNCTSVGDLVELLSHKPKSKRLYGVLKEKKELVKLPNVAVSGRRVVKLDKEKAIGRAKIIEQELRERDLPVFRK